MKKINDYILSEKDYIKHIDSMGGFREGYTLNYEEYSECVKRVIEAVFDKKSPTSRPEAFFGVGQPGAGKTGLLTYIEREARNTPPIKLDPDQIGIYHRNYGKIVKEIPETSYIELQKFIKTALNDTIRNIAIDRKYNILSEGTMNDTEGYIKILKCQRDNQYKINISAMVVHELESRLSCLEREQHEVEMGFIPRRVSREYQKKAYDNFLKTFEMLEKDKLFDEINIYSRGDVQTEPKHRYRVTRELLERNLVVSPTAAIKLFREDNKKEISDNNQQYAERLRKLRERINKNSDMELKNKQLVVLDELEADFNKELNNKHDKTEKNDGEREYK